MGGTLQRNGIRRKKVTSCKTNLGPSKCNSPLRRYNNLPCKRLDDSIRRSARDCNKPSVFDTTRMVSGFQQLNPRVFKALQSSTMLKYDRMNPPEDRLDRQEHCHTENFVGRTPRFFKKKKKKKNLLTPIRCDNKLQSSVISPREQPKYLNHLNSVDKWLYRVYRTDDVHTTRDF